MDVRYRATRFLYGLADKRRRPANGGLALHGGTPVRDERIPWPSWPIFGSRERIELMRTFEGGRWWYGPRGRRFEAAFAQFQGGRYCVTTNSGTSALEIALQVVGVGPGDEFIVPCYTFIATATAGMRLGGVPVFVDVDAEGCLDPDKLEERITPRTRAILPVHFGGRIADMDRINAIANAHGITVVEDAAHAWGARWRHHGAGTLGLGGCFSFQMSKNLTSAEGGALVTNDEALADRLSSIVNCGRAHGRPWYQHEDLGTNARLTEFQAALLLGGLSRLEKQMQTRERNARHLLEGLAGIEGLTLPAEDPRITRHSWHLFSMRIDADRFGCSRDRFIEACRAEGLPVRRGYPEPLYRQPVFAAIDRYRGEHCPMAEELCHHTAVWLAHWYLLGTRADMDHIVEIVRKVRAHAHDLPG